MAKKLLVLKATPWTYQRVAQECALVQVPLYEALERLLKKLEQYEAQQAAYLASPEEKKAQLGRARAEAVDRFGNFIFEDMLGGKKKDENGSKSP